MNDNDLDSDDVHAQKEIIDILTKHPAGLFKREILGDLSFPSTEDSASIGKLLRRMSNLNIIVRRFGDYYYLAENAELAQRRYASMVDELFADKPAPLSNTDEYVEVSDKDIQLLPPLMPELNTSTLITTPKKESKTFVVSKNMAAAALEVKPTRVLKEEVDDRLIEQRPGALRPYSFRAKVAAYIFNHDKGPGVALSELTSALEFEGHSSNDISTTLSQLASTRYYKEPYLIKVGTRKSLRFKKSPVYSSVTDEPKIASHIPEVKEEEQMSTDNVGSVGSCVVGQGICGNTPYADDRILQVVTVDGEPVVANYIYLVKLPQRLDVSTCRVHSLTKRTVLLYSREHSGPGADYLDFPDRYLSSDVLFIEKVGEWQADD